MRRGIPRFRFLHRGLVAAKAALLLAAFVTVVRSQDVVFLRTGPPLKGKIELAGEALVKFRVMLETTAGTGWAMRDLKWEEIEAIDFAPLPGEAETLAHPTAAALPELGRLWLERKKLLARPRSNAAAIGLASAELLIADSSAARRQTGLQIFTEVAATAWSETDRARGREGRLRALLALGRAEEAVKEATELAAKTEDPGMLIEARHVLALASFDKLKKLVATHPKWREEDAVLPERNRLYHETLDLFLYPHLFHGSREETAARGLWSAAQVYEHAAEPARAAECATDILQLYPATAAAAEAKKYLTKKEGAK